MSTQITASLRNLKDLDRIGSRLKKNTLSLLDQFPPEAKTITGMTNWLQTGRSTCQRIVECTSKSDNGIDVILLMPGIGGWEKFIQAVKNKSIQAPQVERIEKLVKEFNNILLQMNVSHNALKKNLSSGNQSVDNQTQYVNDCEELYKAASKVLGEHKKTIFSASIARQDPNDPNLFLSHTLIHHEACKTSKQGRPLFLTVSPVSNQDALSQPPTLSLDKDKDLLATEAVAFIGDYTSENLHSQPASLEEARDAIVISPDTQDDAFDVTMLLNNKNTALANTGKDKISAGLSLSIRNPCQYIYMLVFLEKKIAGHYNVETGIHSIKSSNMFMLESLETIWYDRFPGSPELMIVDPNINFSSKLQYLKANELVNCVFDITQVDRDDYNCYMLKVEYPIWSSVYRIYFNYDFSGK